MVAVVTGTGTGLERSSASILGAVGASGQLGTAFLGQAGERVVVNAYNGNLVLQNTDEVLFGLGLAGNDILSRTYNSQGAFTANGWQESTQRQVSGLVGTVNTAGSTINHVAWDGSVVTYTYNTTTANYSAKEGDGPADTLTFSGTTWTWRDARTQVTETYDSANGGRITGRADLDGNTLAYTYTGTLLTKVTTQNGEFTTLSYSGDNLTQITTSYGGGAATLTRVRYGYDASNRLTSVTVDLTPTDNSVTDGATYVTTYTYDGTSNRVASITQTDGSSLAIAYTLTGGVYKVASLTQTVGGGLAARVTSFNYTVADQTTVTDPLGLQTVLKYNASGQLTQITAPPAVTGGASQNTYFTYNATGDVLTVKAPSAATITFTYSNGNRLTDTDAAGDKITRTFGTANQVLTETLSPASGVSLTTRYVYDVKNHLRYAITPKGNVTEYRYNASGQLVSTIRYAANQYSGTSPTEALLNTWVTGIADKSTTQRTDTTFDFRGNVQSVTSFSKVLASGVGDTSATVSTTNYVYDQSGKLLSRQQVGSTASETYVYDGLFRQTAATDLTGGTTTIAFDDVHAKTIMTLANGTTQTSIYDLTGSLLTTTIAGAGVSTATTVEKYDADGRLRMVTDPSGVKTYFLYDNVGRKVADIQANGTITEYRYTTDNQVAATIQHKLVLTSTQLASLVDASGNPANVALASVLPASDAGDRWNWNVYNSAHSLIETIDSTGAVTVLTYDLAQRLTQTKSYANFLTPTVLAGLKTQLPVAVVLPTADAVHDDITRDFYDNDGLLVAVLDADGFLTQFAYDMAGEKIRTTRSATAATSSLWATGTLAQLVASVSTSSHDEVTNYVYDARGQLRFTVDANARVSEYVYDTFGNVLHRTDYANAITASASYSLSYVQSHLSVSGSDRITRSVYDAANRLVFSIDAEGGVASYKYDSLGHVVKQVAFATAYGTAGDPTMATMTTWATANGAASTNRISRTIYDAAGRAVYAVDPQGYVTEFQYDLASRVLKEIRYAAVYTVTDTTTQSALATTIGALPGTALVTINTYDTAGRLTDLTDPMGFVTHYTLDALGQVTDVTVASGTGAAATTHFAYDNAGRVQSQTSASGTAEATTSSFTYDALGHVLTSTDGRGAVTTRSYDAVGQLLTETVQLDASNTAVTSYQYDAFGNRVKVTDPRGNVGYFYYDNLNRLTLQVDPEGYVTQTGYSRGDQATSVTHYTNRASNLGSVSASVPPTVSGDSKDQTTTIARDRLDRVTATTDAQGYTESYVLNAFGDRTTVINKLGGVTTNVFDRRGMLLSETLPVNSTRADGSVQATAVVNTFSYDARGNKTQMVEASGLTEARTTTYAYDKGNRLIQKQSGGGVNEITNYDARGDVIETVDSNGARTLTYYDRLGRRIATVNAVGTLSTWAYDQNGNMTAVTVYGDAIALPGVAGGSPPSPANASNYRQTINTYDKNNRLTSSKVAGLLVGQYTAGAYQTATADVIVQTFYDKAGNAVQQIDGRGKSVFAFYDKLGHKVAQVDQNNFLTSYTLDADGNVLTEERFATALTGTVTTASDPAALRTSVLAGAGNRVTNFTYDRNGRRISETRLAVNSYGGPANSTVSYTYNGLGEVTLKTEATGDYTTYTYDAGGRLTAAATTAFLDYTGAWVQPQTLTYYDGLNNVTRTRVGAAGSLSSSDHVTTYSYSAGGRLFSTTDAAGFIQYFSYDAAGYLTDQFYWRNNSAGVQVFEDVVTHHDALGRVTWQQTQSLNGSTPVNGDYTTTQYNAYGEVAARGVNGGWQETFSYDAGGRLWRSTADGGVVKLFIYDAAGNQTMEVDAAGVDLSGQSAYGGSLLAANTGVAMTYRVFDNRGQMLQTLWVNRQLTAGVTQTLTDTKVFNAFGEVTQDTDARNYVTNFTYNTMGRLTQQLNPNVDVTAENGAITSVRTSVTYDYDASGRLIHTTDANGAGASRTLLAGTGYGGGEPVVIGELHADNGITQIRVDVFGNARTITNEIGRVETRTYDAMDRLITVAHPQRADGARLTDNYSYDQLGREVAQWNSQMGASVRQTTDYDLQGRVTKTVDYGGHATTYAYAWNGSLTTAGLGTFGGWTKVTTTADGTKTSTDVVDYFGHTVNRVDFGGHAYAMTFSTGGRLLTQLGTSQQSMTYTYFNTGKVATSIDLASAQNTTYGYDAAGNQTLETVAGSSTYYDPTHGCGVGPSVSLQQSVTSYDALNRMITLTDTGQSGGPDVSITYEYDANGNIRHIASTYNDVVSGLSTTEDDWYKYDSMNRFVTTKGQFTGVRGSGVISRGARGVDITYNAAGERISATSTSPATDILVPGHYQPDAGHWVTTPAHLAPGHHVDGYWQYDCVPAHIQPGTTTPGHWVDTPAVNLHDGYTIAAHYDYECVPAQYIPGSTTPGYWASSTTPGYWIPGTTTPGYDVYDASGNYQYTVPPSTTPDTWVPESTTYWWVDPVTEPDVFIPMHMDWVWKPPIVVPDTILPATHVWVDAVTTPDLLVPEQLVGTWVPPHDLPDTWIPESTAWVVTPGQWVPAGYIHSSTEHAEYYAYTEDGYLSTVSISDGSYDPVLNATTPPSLATALLRGLDVRDAMGRVTSHVEFAPGTGPQGTILVPGHFTPAGGNWQTIPAHIVPGQHTAGYMSHDCAPGYIDPVTGQYVGPQPIDVWVPPVDTPDTFVAASSVWVETPPQWVPDSYVAAGSGPGPVSPGSYAVYVRNAVYDNNSNEISEDTATLNADGSIGVSSSVLTYTSALNGAYMGGVVTRNLTTFATVAAGPSVYWALNNWINDNVQAPKYTADTRTAYVWWNQALQGQIVYTPNTSQAVTNTTDFDYNGDGRLQTVTIHDGRPRTITYVDNSLGQIISRIDSTGPREYYYNFGGMQRGDVGNNGRRVSDTDYAASIAAHQAAVQTGAFANGVATSFADFDQSYTPINPASDSATGSSYTVRDGDTLQGIAAALWGDSSLWYLIADANGLAGGAALAVGTTLLIPNKVTNLHNSSSTFRVYDPNKAIGDVLPNTPQPTPQPAPAAAKHKHGCGIAQIIVAVVAVVVAAIVAPYAAGAIANIAAGGGAAGAAAAASATAAFAAGGSIASLSGAALVGAIGGGAVGAAVGSIASQGLGIAMGVQDKFSWGAVGLAAIGGGVGVGVSKFMPGSGFIAGAQRGVVGNVASQGIGIATGLQSKFDWAGVAVGGIVGGVSTVAGAWASDTIGFSPIGTDVISGAAGLVAGAATRSVLTGTDFGDNILADLPSVIGSTIGNAIVGGFQGASLADNVAHDLGILGRGIEHAGAALFGGISGLFSGRGAAPPGAPGPAPAGPTPPVPPTATATVGPITVTSLPGGDPQKVADELKLLPADALDFLARKHVKFVAVPDSVADFDTSLKGQVPRGYQGLLDAAGNQMTWDSVAGMYDPSKNTVVIGTSGKNSHGSWDFVLHETGHAVDRWLGYASKTTAFAAAYAPTATTYNPASRSDAYYTLLGNPSGYYSEIFAESFAGYYRGLSSTPPTQNWNTGPGVANITTGRPTLTSYWQALTWPSPPPPPKPRPHK